MTRRRPGLCTRLRNFRESGIIPNLRFDASARWELSREDAEFIAMSRSKSPRIDEHFQDPTDRAGGSRLFTDQHRDDGVLRHDLRWARVVSHHSNRPYAVIRII